MKSVWKNEYNISAYGKKILEQDFKIYQSYASESWVKW